MIYIYQITSQTKQKSKDMIMVIRIDSPSRYKNAISVGGKVVVVVLFFSFYDELFLE